MGWFDRLMHDTPDRIAARTARHRLFSERLNTAFSAAFVVVLVVILSAGAGLVLWWGWSNLPPLTQQIAGGIVLGLCIASACGLIGQRR
jgi:hypothetical protein